MRGKHRTDEEWNELLPHLEYYLGLGFSLKKACNLSGIAYSSLRDLTARSEAVRASTVAFQNRVNALARANIVKNIEEGSIPDSKWWIERFDNANPLYSLEFATQDDSNQDFIEGLNNTVWDAIDDSATGSKERKNLINSLPELFNLERGLRVKTKPQ